MECSFNVILLCTYLWRKDYIRLKYDVEEWSILSKYCSTKNVNNCDTNSTQIFI